MPTMPALPPELSGPSSLSGRSALSALNWPHLALLAALPPYAWLSRGWPPPLVLGLAVITALGWLLWCERHWPARAEWQPSAADLRRDTAFLGLNSLTDALGGLLIALVALALARAGWAMGWAADWPPLLALPLAIVLGELGPYALHRWAHQAGPLWRIHRLHHRPVAVNAGNSVLAHPINVLWNQVSRVLPWLLLGFSPQVMLWATLFLQVQGLAVHANVRGHLGWLNHWIGSAELHRWHHSLRLDEARNFGTALPLWDQLFGSFVHRPGQMVAQVGCEAPSGPVSDWRAQLLEPMPSCCLGPKGRS